MMSSKSREEVSDDDRCCKKRGLDENKRVQDLDEKPLDGIRVQHGRRRTGRGEDGRAKKRL